MKYAILTILAVLTPILYRMGGSSKYDKLWRRIGCAVTTTLMIGLLTQWHWLLIPSCLALYGALTTYLSEFQKPNDHVSKTEWFLTGALYGLAGVVLIPVIGWLPVLVRTIALGSVTCVWSYNIDDAVTEELGRGLLLALSTLILLI